MSKSIGSSEMRAIEEAAFKSGSVASLDLMERAGNGVVEETIRSWPDVTSATTEVIVFCGPGNNGGDGFVVARLLAARGFAVRAFFYGRRERLSDDAGENYDRWADTHSDAIVRLGFPELTSDDHTSISEAYSSPENLLVIDALFGIGLDRVLTKLQPLLDAHEKRRVEHPLPKTLCVAVDVPSGLTDHGPVSVEDNSVMKADLTVTFHQLKHAHVAAPAFCGKVTVHDIGL